ncbi:MAG: response regulator transcription factor [Bryobacteraceae bacterium]
MSRKPRILIVDDHPVTRLGLGQALADIATVVGEATNGMEAAEQVKEHKPDIVVMAVSIPRLNGIEAAERIVKAHPAVRVIMFTRHDDEQHVWRALQVGASGYVLKSGALAEVKAAVQRVSAGEIYLSRAISARLRNRFPLQRVARFRNPLELLTSRQREILQLIAEGGDHQGYRADS